MVGALQLFVFLNLLARIADNGKIRQSMGRDSPNAAIFCFNGILLVKLIVIGVN